MLNRINILLTEMGIAILLVACSSSVIDTSTVVPTHSSPVQPSSESFQETATSDPLWAASATTAVINGNLLAIETVSCQDLPKINNSDLAGTGFVFYYIHNAPGVGAISLADSSQQKLFENLGNPAYGIELSPDRNTISFPRFGEDLILLNLMTGMTRSIPFDKSWSLANPAWSQDGRIIAHTTGDTPLRFHFLDTLTLTVEDRIRPTHWPEVHFNSTHPSPGSGFITTDLTETYAVYTERRVESNYAINYVLRNVQDGHELWHTENIGYEYYVKPIWDEVGNQFLLVLPETEDRDYTLVIGLTPDGQEIEIARIAQLPGVGADFEIRYLELSHNQRYIHFGLFETIETGPGYILDTYTHTIYEICEPNFVQGWWLPGEEGGRLMYLVDKDNGERVLKLLDVTTWQDKELLVTDVNFDMWNVIGWTPVEIP